MRKSAIMLIFLFFLNPCTTAKEVDFSTDNPPASIYNSIPDNHPQQTFRTTCDDCQLEIDLENEIKSLLDIIPVHVTLDECLDVAVENNFNLASSGHIYRQRKYEYGDSLSNFLPNAGLNFQMLKNDGRALVRGRLISGFHETTLTFSGNISHDLTQGGRQIFLAKSANQLKKASHHDLKFTKAEVLLNTSLNYYKALQSKLEIEIYIKNYGERLAQLKLVKDQEAAGLGTKFDVMRAENEKLDAEQSLLDAANRFRLNQASLANVMGVDVSVPLTPIESEVGLTELLEADYAVEKLYDLALDYREDLKSLKSEIKSMKNIKTSIYTEFFPNAQINYQYAYQGTTKTGLGPHGVLTVDASIPIGNRLGFSTVNRAKAQQEIINSTQNILKQRLQDIKEAIVGSYYSSKISKEKAGIAKRQIRYASESVRLAELRQQAGEGILIDVIQAQSMKTQTRIAYVVTVIEYNISQIQLLFDSGIISLANILKNYNP